MIVLLKPMNLTNVTQNASSNIERFQMSDFSKDEDNNKTTICPQFFFVNVHCNSRNALGWSRNVESTQCDVILPVFAAPHYGFVKNEDMPHEYETCLFGTSVKKV